MMDRPVRVGVIGCGAQGQNHCRVIRELGESEAVVTAYCDLSEERLAKASQLWPQARAARDFRQLLEPGDLDLVIVVTMPNTHASMCIAAIEAGANVLCEKPFMMNLEEAVQVLGAAAKAGKQVQVGTNMRYMSSSRYLRDLVVSGQMGDPVFCKAWGCHQSPPVWGPHYELAKSGGGVLASTLIHGLDLAIWVGGAPNPISVSASTRRLFPGKRGEVVSQEVRDRFDAEDLLTALVRFDNGATYVLEGNWCDEVKDWHRFELVTTRGTVINNSPFAVKMDEEGKVVDHTPKLQGCEGWSDDWQDSIRLQDADVIGRLRQGKAWEMQDHRQLLNLQKVVDGCYESARRGREIAV
ncbi:MAG: Gfo/Idh/MocA family oxidoreductase [Candidatus Latescibacteria bacterium]|nr:Gfo/Idh/MocA family oxidoreductase [Candidatus Latescibacterota bacterium]